MTSKTLGEILVEQGIIDREALDRALRLQNRRLGEILVQEKLADPIAIAHALKFQAKARSLDRQGQFSIQAPVLDDLLHRLETVEDQLQESLSAVRTGLIRASVAAIRESIEHLMLEPTETLFDCVRVVAQQAATQTGKEVTVNCIGESITLDRHLIEELSDIAMHLVRNAIDHGIESPEARRSGGKPQSGHLELEVIASGGLLVMSIRDDGRGIDEIAVRQKAVELGLLPAEPAQVSPEEILRVLFTPGFSTNSKVTDLSGRGVGLDVVEAAVLRLGGSVQVHNLPGQGAEFKVSVPLRLGRLPVQPLRLGAEWLGVSVGEIVSMRAPAVGESLLSPAVLFGGHGAKMNGTGGVRVETITGDAWQFDEAGQEEAVLVREAPSITRQTHGVIGSARLKQGRNVLIVSLGKLRGSLATRAQ